MAALGRLAVAGKTRVAAIANVPHCVVALAEQADLPPQEAGVILEIPVKRRRQVDKGQLLLQLDDRKAQKELEVAEAKYEAAMAKANDDINIRYAVAAAAVAKAEYEVNKKANERRPRFGTPGAAQRTVPQVQGDRTGHREGQARPDRRRRRGQSRQGRSRSRQSDGRAAQDPLADCRRGGRRPRPQGRSRAAHRRP